MYRHHRNFRTGRRSLGNLRGAIWLIGLGFLMLSGHWWPGILVLIGISIVLEGLAAGMRPPELEDFPPSPPPVAPPPPAPMPQPTQVSAPAPEHPFALLPANCPRCGGPVRKDEIKWVNRQTALCAYCGSGLPLREK